MAPSDDSSSALAAERLEALVVECVRRWPAEGADAIDGACAAHPALAVRLRARVERLRALGLFGDEPQGESLPSFGRYRTLAVLGQGGMGVVYLALDEELQRHVALKVVRAGSAPAARARERFAREVRAVARLAHPNVVAIHDVGEEAGFPFFAMEHVDGHSLRTLLDGLRALGRAPWALDAGDAMELGAPAGSAHVGASWFERAAQIALEVARALDHVHVSGVVHRDVKPSNVLIGPDGRAQLVDFGLAQLEEGARVTHSRDLVGTPHYLSPEQVAEGPGAATARSDVYALGVTLYEMIALRVPFDGESAAQVLRAIDAGDATTLFERLGATQVPRDLAAICAAAMERDPARRYPCASDLARDLERFLAAEPVSVRAPGARDQLARFARRHRVLVGVLTTSTVSLALGLALVTIAWRRALRAEFLANARLEETEQLADSLLVHELEQEADALWPARPERRAALRDWLGRADRLLERRALHEDFLSRAAAVQGFVVAEVARELESVGLAQDLRERWRVRTVEELVADLEAFGMVRADVARRLERADGLSARSARDAGLWEATVEGVARDPTYAGVELAPIPGLVPLGHDPDSGLLELWHVESGARPERGAEGRLVCAEDTGIVLVLLPGGIFTMGADPARDPSAIGVETPRHDVVLAPFLAGKWEVTQGQWLRVSGANPSFHTSAAMPGFVDPRHPVENLTWDEADRWLRRVGLALPTEAQWEYLARGGTTTTWWTGDDLRSIEGAGNIGDHTARLSGASSAWGHEGWLQDGHVISAPVGSYLGNPFGLYDVIGNVMEWCRDPSAVPYSSPARPPEGLRDPESCSPAIRGVRSGAFLMDASQARSACRAGYQRSARLSALGVRPVLLLTEP